MLGSFYLCLCETCILLMAGPSQGYRESFLHAVNHSNLGSVGTGLWAHTSQSQRIPYNLPRQECVLLLRLHMLLGKEDFINYSSPLSSDTAGTYWRVNLWSLDAVSEGSCHFSGHQADLPFACLWYLLQVLLPGLPLCASRETMQQLLSLPTYLPPVCSVAGSS